MDLTSNRHSQAYPNGRLNVPAFNDRMRRGGHPKLALSLMNPLLHKRSHHAAQALKGTPFHENQEPL
jgi:hypothetical protein